MKEENLIECLKPKSEEEILVLTKNLNADELLYKSARYGFLPGVKKALGRGADVHTLDDYALRWASIYCNYDIVKLLLDSGADVHTKNDWALRHASGKGHYNIVKLLLKHGADVHASNDLALRRASENGHYSIVKYLLDNGATKHEITECTFK